jgi:hypothetical protein
MTDENKYSPPTRPDLAIRVGITGSRALDALRARDPTQWIWIEQQLRDVLRFIRLTVAELATREDVKECYASRRDRRLYWLLSPLAEGADRLAAHVALAEDYRLFVPMPFRQSEYENDFVATSGSLDEFRRLLAHADGRSVELDGARNQAGGLIAREARSYEAVGRFVARNCDVLVAIWDGQSPEGRGGTFDTLRFATEIGVPVWWIHARSAVSPAWLSEPVEPEVNLQAPPFDELARYLTNLIAPPVLSDEGSGGSLIEASFRWLFRDGQATHREYLLEPEPDSRSLWRTHGKFTRMLAFHPSGDSTLRAYERQQDRAPYWAEHYDPPDRLSVAFANRYRSVYLLIFALTALSLFFAATPLLRMENEITARDGVGRIHEIIAKGLSPTAIVVEAVAIFAIFALVAMNLSLDWHRRWLDYRVLAELFRKQSALAPLGWTLPRSWVSGLSDPPDGPRRGSDRGAWIAWFQGAVVRAAPLPRGVLQDQLSAARDHILNELVRGQLAYHARREADYQIAERRLVRGGELLFLCIIVLALVKLFDLSTGRPIGGMAEFLAVVLPTFAAALVGIRHYTEMELLVRQSEHMIRVMNRAEARLLTLDLNQPFASQDLGSIGLGVAIEMLKDIDDWVRLFRVKVVEAS